MQNRRNYYRILHVQQDAPLEIIKTSYRTLMQRMRMHPDLGGDHWQASLINEAYATLSDPQRRANYDETLEISAEELRQMREAESGHAADDEADAVDVEVPSADLCPFCRTPHYLDNIAEEARCVNCFSPLFPTRQHHHEDSSRRSVKRMPKNLAVTFYMEWPRGQGLERSDHRPFSQWHAIHDRPQTAGWPDHQDRLRPVQRRRPGAQLQVRIGDQTPTLADRCAVHHAALQKPPRRLRVGENLTRPISRALCLIGPHRGRQSAKLRSAVLRPD